MISRADVEHIARLARIELTESEQKKFQQELSSILEFVAKLGEVDTSNVEPLAGGTDLKHVMREDAVSIPRNTETGPSLVEAAPKKRDGRVEVKAVFERE
ncbi:MAG: Asp-tRNA(Asn)/Glu-tRNA(Gln) amidotransferase subunit GatC [Patescibacteria group bacterium]